MALLDLSRIFRLSPRTSPQRPAARRCRPRVEPLEDRMLLSTFVVTNTNDSGAGSLRSAIQSVNADPSPSLDCIDFNIAPTAPKTINLKLDLPILTHQVFI